MRNTELVINTYTYFIKIINYIQSTETSIQTWSRFKNTSKRLNIFYFSTENSVPNDLLAMFIPCRRSQERYGCCCLSPPAYFLPLQLYTSFPACFVPARTNDMTNVWQEKLHFFMVFKDVKCVSAFVVVRRQKKGCRQNERRRNTARPEI